MRPTERPFPGIEKVSDHPTPYVLRGIYLKGVELDVLWSVAPLVD
ncbi:MAG: hypothetical protein OJF50_004797 [Nitrospira sp.]|jgi:hypothetical protein|nr:hypothetical protein [Nitrospira sp.]